MVKGGIGPEDRVMTLLAGLRKAGLRVIGSGRALVILQVARDACRSCEVVVVVDVAVGAGSRRSCMRAREHESRG